MTRIRVALLGSMLFAIVRDLKWAGDVQFTTRQQRQVMQIQVHGIPAQRSMRQLTTSAAQRREGEKSDREPNVTTHVLASVQGHRRRNNAGHLSQLSNASGQNFCLIGKV